jgi:serine/threonine protein kinase
VAQPSDKPTYIPPDPGPPAGAVGDASLVTRLIDDMHAAWHNGQAPRAEDILAAHPELQTEAEAALRIIHEEIILRSESGEAISTVEIARRFPQWADDVRHLLEVHRELSSALFTFFPEVGGTLGDFQLLAELGRGAQGRVFLARQQGLADRPMVLKASPRDGHEHLSLARLQHTHIVPLYWAQDYPDRNLRVLCMPYLGGATLGAALRALPDRPPATRTGRDLLEALDKAEPTTPVRVPHEGPARLALGRESYVRAVCRLAAGLADALHYAHEHGLVHLDLKPGNVLVAADGTPLLLDFHLARGPLHAGDGPPDWLGGTPGYMAPEQEETLAAVRRREKVPRDVDGRADVYALGRLLYEALGSRLTDKAGPVPLRQLNPEVSVGLADVVARCLSAEPGRRYRTAGELAADLRRHLNDLPLRGVRNRSVAERWRKWRRRSPHALPLGLLLLGLVIALGAAGVLALRQVERHHHAVQDALIKGQMAVNAGRVAEGEDHLRKGRELADSSFLTRDLVPTFDQHLRLAERTRKVQELHAWADRARVWYVTGFVPSKKNNRRVGDVLLGLVWQGRGPLLDPSAPRLRADLEKDLGADLLDLAVCWADLHVAWGPKEQQQKRREQALALLDEAERALGPSAALERERQTYAQALGKEDMARKAGERTVALAAKEKGGLTSALVLLRRQQTREAIALLERLRADDPKSFGINFALGIGHLRLDQPAAAVNHFSVCVGKPGDEPEAYEYRAKAFAATKDFARQREDEATAERLRLDRGELGGTVTNGLGP